MNPAPGTVKRVCQWAGILAAASCSLGVLASAAAPSPLDPAAVVPAPAFRSALLSYVGGPPPPVGDWRSAMDTVTRIGGWREYAKQGLPASAPVHHSSPTAPAAPGDAPKR